MPRYVILTLTLLFLVLGTTAGFAVTVDLFDWGFNVDGTTYCNLGPCDYDVGFTGNLSGPGDLPTFIDTSGFDFGTGLGTITLTFDPGAAGTYFIGGFFDHEIDESINTFFNESGATHGTPAAGQSWEIDEPGFVFGDIFTNFVFGILDNANGVPAGFEDDVSLALGWSFTLADGEFAIINFVVSTTSPGGFYLSQTDPDSNFTLYFSSHLQVVPEPGTLVLLGSGLVGLVWERRRRKKQG